MSTGGCYWLRRAFFASIMAILTLKYNTRATKRQTCAHRQSLGWFVKAPGVGQRAVAALNGADIGHGLAVHADFIKLMTDMNSLPSMLISSSSEKSHIPVALIALTP